LSYNFSAVNVNKIQTIISFQKAQNPKDVLFFFPLEIRKSVELHTKEGSVHYHALLALFCWHKAAVNSLFEATEGISNPKNILHRSKIGPLFI